MTWSQLFTSSPNPYAFLPQLDTETWTKKNNSVESVSELEQLLKQVVVVLNEEGQKINQNYLADINSIRSAIPGNYSGMTYQQRFNAIVNYGRQALTQSRNTTVNRTDLEKFYQQYYFYSPTKEQLDNLENVFKANDYGFGTSTQLNLKTSALNRSIEFGLVPETTTVEQYESFTNPSNRELFVQRLQEINGTEDNRVINPSNLESNPYEAAYALIELRESGKLDQSSDGKYQWSSTGKWQDLAAYNNGALLDVYQRLIDEFDRSEEKKKGITLSQYLSQKNRDRFKQIEKEIASKKQAVDTEGLSKNDAKALVVKAVDDQVKENVKDLNTEDTAKEAKINALRSDAFREAQAALSKQKRLETINDKEVFGEMNDMFQSMGRELGLRDGFLKMPGFQSNISFNWQNWFENELRTRYNPTSNRNQLRNIIGNSEADAKLGAKFVQDFLQKRFDGSKSLSEFAEYVESANINPVLEERAKTALDNFAKKGYKELVGNIDDSKSVLGNFWTNLLAIWDKGRSFDSDYYLGQTLATKKNGPTTVKQLHNNISKIDEIAVSKRTINLDPRDIKDLDLRNVNRGSNAELVEQIELYKAWINKAYSEGVDIRNEKEFAKLHFDSYAKNPVDPTLGLQAGIRLQMNDSKLFSGEENKKMADQVEFLTKQANEYLSQVQFGTFKTPEEHLIEMIKKTGVDGGKGLFGETGINEAIKEYFDKFSGVISTLAGESIRKQIKEAIQTGQTPDQKALGIEYIQRTKDQALSTIRGLISKEYLTDKVIIDNVKGMSLNESVPDWFTRLGLELNPGQAWFDYRRQNNIDPSLSYYDWEKRGGAVVDIATGLPAQRKFWNFWATKNNVEIIETKDPDSNTKTRVTIVVDQPSPSWVAWGKRISKSDAANPNLEGAQVSVRSDSFNTDWYSKTNPYTKIKDEWNKIVTGAGGNVIDTKGKPLGEWARENGMNPEEAWVEYRNKRQEDNRNFGKDSSGSNVSFVTWSQTASKTDQDAFWRGTNSFWFNYLKGLGTLKGGNPDNPKFQTWTEWASTNKITLNRLGTDAKEMPPREFMEIHFYALGGNKKVNEEYLRTYFPEFGQLASQTDEKTGLAKTPFDLSAFGLQEETSFDLQPITKTNRKSVSPIDFAMKEMFGDSMDGDSFDFGQRQQSPLNDFKLKMDMAYNKNKNRDPMNFSFGFGDFGGPDFGF